MESYGGHWSVEECCGQAVAPHDASGHKRTGHQQKMRRAYLITLISFPFPWKL